MSPVSAADVAALRARTGVSMMACKEALDAAGGDQEKAIDILRKRGIAQAVKKADRAQNEGALFVAQTPGKAALVALKCETDFVGRNADFITMGQTIAQHMLEHGSQSAKDEADKMLPASVQKLGENISIGEMLEVEAATVGCYVHSNRKIAVVVGLGKPGMAEQAKDVAMHAAAMSPGYVYPEDVPEETLAKEREIWREQLKNEKKPEAMWDKIMLGKERKFREENALAKQPFVKDPNVTIEKYLGGARIESYMRVAL